MIEHTVTVHNITLPFKTTVVTCDLNARWKGEYTGPVLKGSQEWTYAATDGGLAVKLVMETELLGPARLAARMVIRALDAMADQALANLKARLEA